MATTTTYASREAFLQAAIMQYAAMKGITPQEADDLTNFAGESPSAAEKECADLLVYRTTLSVIERDESMSSDTASLPSDKTEYNTAP